MRISFHGAVEAVTGSCHLIELNDKKILLDCGQFQGSKLEEEMNFEEFMFNPAEIDYLFLSHCHIDHCGRIPLLVKRGFKGDIICTKPTYELCEIMLQDSAHIHESEAEWASRKAMRAGRKQVEPLYTQDDAAVCMKYFKPCLYNQLIKLTDDISVRFSDAGHILGSSVVEMWLKDTDEKIVKIVFSGDLGVEDKPILNDPTYIKDADYIIVESTYGNRVRENTESKIDLLVDVILKTARRGGNVIIPSFAVGRTQEIIYELNKLYESDNPIGKELRKIPVYIDSPLATKTTEVFKLNAQAFDEETRQLLLSGDNPLHFENLNFVQSAIESKNLNEDRTPKIIISASGMCEAGRIKHHLKHNLWRAESSIVFVGYQAENTLGRRIRDGEKLVKIFGEEISVNAEIYDIEGFSGHADMNGLMNWLGAFERKPYKVFIVHGEEDSKKDFAAAICKKLDFNCIIPKKGEIYRIGSGTELIDRLKNKDEIGNLPNVGEDKVKNLIDDIHSTRQLCENALELAKNSLNEVVDVEQYNKINNKLIELENALMDLTMISGK